MSSGHGGAINRRGEEGLTHGCTHGPRCRRRAQQLCVSCRRARYLLSYFHHEASDQCVRWDALCGGCGVDLPRNIAMLPNCIVVRQVGAFPLGHHQR